MRRSAALLLTLPLLLALCACAPAHTPQETIPPVESAQVQDTNPWLEDYDYFWQLVEENFPTYAAAQRISGRDFRAVKEQYRAKAAQVEDADELYGVLYMCAREFQGAGHFGLLSEGMYCFIMDLFRDTADPKSRYEYDLLNNPTSREYYSYSDPEEVPEGDGQSAGEQAESSLDNLIFKYYPDYGAAYVEILSMDMSHFAEERQALENFFARIQAEGYRHCIVDIRRNGGGDSSYGTTAVVGPNIMEDTFSTHYALVRRGSAMIDYFRTMDNWLTLRPIDELPVEALPALEPGDVALATHFYMADLWAEASPAAQVGGPLFSGRFWLLVGSNVYSASESFAIFCKDTGFATLVGETTGGDGIGVNPYLCPLPNSGICVRFSAENGLNADGSCNEEYGTQPDIPNAPGMNALETCLAAIREESGKND